MKTKHFQSEIERLNLLERAGELTEHGKDMLIEFIAINKALTIVNKGKQKKGLQKGTYWNEDVCSGHLK